ncbi:hypothetical protein LIER_17075 [Lithospermum erythrorhizon]|uniref:Centromere protein C n=1 Tax=Lithospermum erythrorhizon TaxID=34254 RepID=A0AAV3QAZ9_LITER
MASEPPDSERVDPLSHIRGLSQFPNSIRVSSDSNHLDSIHQTIKSLGVNNPEKVLEEAKKIVDGDSELLNSNYATFIASMGIEDASLEMENEKPLQRRPGFGRRRAKFSMKRNSSQPDSSLLTSFDVAKFPDPEEFFSELQKHENAQKEIKRLMGVSSIDEDIPPHNALKRRPGILGDRRRSVNYKYHRAKVISETEETDVPSPEPIELTVPKPPNNNSHETNSDFNVELPDYDAAGPKTEHEVNMILDELLSSNTEDLDGYGAVSLLQERLNIKPIDLSTLSIPNFNDTEKIDYVSLGKNLPLPQKSSFSVEDFMQGTPLTQKQMVRSANRSLESSTPRNLLGSLSLESSTPRNLLGSLSELRKRVMQSNPLGDLFSPLDIDLTEPTNSQPDQGSKPTDPNTGLGERSTEGSLAGVSIGKILSRQSSHIDVAENISHINFFVNDDGNEINGNIDHKSTGNAGVDSLMDGPPQEKENVEVAPNLSMPSFQGPERTGNDTTNKIIDNHEPSLMEENVSRPERTGNDTTNSSIDNHAPSLMEENVKDVPSAILSAQVDISCKESMIPDNVEVEVDPKSLDGPHADAANDCTSEMLPTVRVSISEKETEKLPSKDQEHKRRKTAVGILERKSLSKRQSILAGGTTFESGVRRSKRIKTRPLEYWKGERLLYAWVNGSLKLTGMQYISPSKDNGILKVKSFI